MFCFSLKILFLTASLSSQGHLPGNVIYPLTNSHPQPPHHEEAPLQQDEHLEGKPQCPDDDQTDKVISISNDQEIIEYYEYVDDTELDVDNETSEETEKAYSHSSGGFIWWFGFPKVTSTFGHK